MKRKKERSLSEWSRYLDPENKASALREILKTMPIIHIPPIDEYVNYTQKDLDRIKKSIQNRCEGFRNES